MLKQRHFVLLASILFVSLAVLPVVRADPIADVAYIVSNSNGVDNYLLIELESLGYTYDIIYEPEIQSADFMQYRMIIVGDQRFNNQNIVPVGLYRMIVLNSYHYYAQSPLDYQWGLSYSRGLKTSPTMMYVENEDSSLVLDLPTSGTFRAYSITDPNLQTAYLKGAKPMGIDIALSSGTAADAVLAGFEIGTPLLSGDITQERIVFFGATKPQHWTEYSRIAFRNSLDWVLSDEDFDQDGYSSRDDCDDNDPDVYPGAIEVPYDNVDQDCDGSDLLDLDWDGYCAEGTNITDREFQCPYEQGSLGTDCDDEDFEINIDNPDPLLNCINDAPIVEPLLDYDVSEGEAVEIFVDAYDPEGADLEYRINDSRFSVDWNVLTWQTTFGDQGEHNFIVSVSDGDAETNVSVRVFVEDVNQPPVAEIIEPIDFDEDGSVILNLSNYFSDPDEDHLFFEIEDVSPDLNARFVSPEIVNLSGGEDFFGEGWIVFRADDGLESAISDYVQINVAPVNDAPFLFENIPNLTVEESTPDEEALYVEDYFIDVDSELTYTISGGEHIHAKIIEGVLQLTPDRKFIGEESFTINASDGEHNVQSNEFFVQVIEINNAPIFENFECENPIEEDIAYNCEINVSDDENDPIEISISDSENMDCSIIGNMLQYSGAQDYDGDGWCTISASDGFNTVEETLEFSILGVNDAPEIKSSNPAQGTVNAIENKSTMFSLNLEDVDSSNLMTEWYVDGNLAFTSFGDNPGFMFRKPAGPYFVEAKVSDQREEISASWSVIVGPLSAFTCSAVGGSVCELSEKCTQSVVSVKDSAVCCLAECRPAFKAAKGCDVSNESLEIDISNPSSGEEFDLGDTINARVYIKNYLDEDVDSKLEFYLYDLTSDKAIENEQTEFSLDENQRSSVTLDLEIPTDIDLDHEYAVYAKTRGDVCSDAYESIDVIRPENRIELSDFNLPKTASCGESIKGKIRLENVGSEEQVVYVRLVNDELGIDQQIAEETIEEYDEDDTLTKEFSVIIPREMDEGEYNFTVEASFGSGIVSASEEVEISCSAPISSALQDIPDDRAQEKLKLNKGSVAPEDKKTGPISGVLIVWNIGLLTIAGMLYFVFGRRSRKSDKASRTLGLKSGAGSGRQESSK